MVYSPGGGPASVFKWWLLVAHEHTLQWDGGLLGAPIAWSSAQEIRGGKVNRGLSFLRPRFHFLLCGSSWWGGWGSRYHRTGAGTRYPGKKTWRVPACPGIVCTLPSLLKVNWAVTTYTEPLRDLIPRHSLDTFRPKTRKGIGEQTLSQASFLAQSLGGKSSTLCLYHKYSD